MLPLSAEEKLFLLRLARQAILSRFHAEPVPKPHHVPERLRERCGAFVTLHMENQLRGCVGLPFPQQRLVDAVKEAAVSAAFDDPRFAPLRFEELPRLKLEISVLTAPQPIAPQDVRAGEHGLLVTHSGRRGLLLPQVATEYGWSTERFLAETCRKAGLPADAWQHGAVIEAFTAEVFEEQD